MYFSPSQDGARLPALPVPCQRAALFQARAEPKLDMLILFLTVAINPTQAKEEAGKRLRTFTVPSHLRLCLVCC